MGVFEISSFSMGTKSIASAIANLKNCFTLVGGGDSAAAVKNIKYRFSHVSTGGGAMLYFLSHKTLPILNQK